MFHSSRRPQRLSSLAIEKLVHECYALHYLLLNLGFVADDLFAGTSHVSNWNPPGLCATVELRTQGLSFVYVLRPLVSGDDARFMRCWLEFAQKQPEMERARLDEAVQSSEVWQTKHDILESLAVKGFVFPSVVEKERSEERGREHDVN